ncbi:MULTISPECIES: hypothetical protein [Moraxella]|uniref:Uncharacterized protein n=1 Tax=Moraxella lacunata TaxID=477 RepID=A0A1B8PVQ6_MORLA|nr:MULTISPECIES: hypothetical protein [Moraxella]MBE9579683.1 hypothetical protein [Moraxella sp. K1664]MBE9589000.1 hypothetical protein [Moraxella sp. K1630]MBE9591598.1 hypothetical protein [Moraxella sp. K127]MBE9597274.1 hypothetical protein [Moraxella sp. K2450]MDH9219779.1 hypothetical protein [Moraxella lacunata]
MLKVIDDGVSITLNGTESNPVFIMAGVLVALAVCVAVVAMTAPVEITIGVMAVFAVLIFGFNIYKNRLKYQSRVATGVIIIKNRAFIAQGQNVKLSDNARIELINDALVITDLGRSWHILGFDNDKERQVAKSVLEGKALEKREQAIRIL